MFALSPVDQVFIGEDSYSIEFAFFYGSKLDVKKLESSLKKALQKFWPLHKTLKLQNGIYGLDLSLIHI